MVLEGDGQGGILTEYAPKNDACPLSPLQSYLASRAVPQAVLPEASFILCHQALECAFGSWLCALEGGRHKHKKELWGAVLEECLGCFCVSGFAQQSVADTNL